MQLCFYVLSLGVPSHTGSPAFLCGSGGADTALLEPPLTTTKAALIALKQNLAFLIDIERPGSIRPHCLRRCCAPALPRRPLQLRVTSDPRGVGSANAGVLPGLKPDMLHPSPLRPDMFMFPNQFSCFTSISYSAN